MDNPHTSLTSPVARCTILQAQKSQPILQIVLGPSNSAKFRGRLLYSSCQMGKEPEKDIVAAVLDWFNGQAKDQKFHNTSVNKTHYAAIQPTFLGKTKSYSHSMNVSLKQGMFNISCSTYKLLVLDSAVYGQKEMAFDERLVMSWDSESELKNINAPQWLKELSHFVVSSPQIVATDQLHPSKHSSFPTVIAVPLVSTIVEKYLSEGQELYLGHNCRLVAIGRQIQVNVEQEPPIGWSTWRKQHRNRQLIVKGVGWVFFGVMVATNFHGSYD